MGNILPWKSQFGQCPYAMSTAMLQLALGHLYRAPE